MRVLVISDIHGNADALEAVLTSASGFDQVWVLGDLVDYGPEPHVVVDAVRDLNPDVVLMGNHDYAVAYNTDCKCAAEIHDLSVYTRQSISYKLLTREQIEWLKGLTRVVKLELPLGRVYLVHGAPRSPLYGYLKPGLTEEELKFMLTEESGTYTIKRRLVDTDYVIAGHTHIPLTLRFKGITVLNPGSVGQPRDGDARASYALFNADSGEFVVYRVKYEVERVIKKLRSLNLDSSMLVKLETLLRNGKI